MASIEKALLRHLLMLDESWDVVDYRLDLRKRRCDIWIAQEIERTWFGRSRKSQVPTQQSTWRHVDLGPIKFYLTVALPVGYDTRGMTWIGETGMPFTHALASRVFALFNEGVSLQAICTLLDLSLNDVWRYRYALDNGRTGADGAMHEAGHTRAGPPTEPPKPASAAPAAAPATVAAAAESSPNVPDVTDPIWLRLLDGDLNLDIRMLSLKLMLTRVRSQLEVITDDEVRMLKLRELHRYFVRNERVLTHELSQLRESVTQ